MIKILLQKQIKMRKSLTSILTILFILYILAQSKPFLHVKNNKIYDENGGERIFHGINLVVKQPPYYDRNFGEKDLQRLKEKGINGIRLGVMWPGVEPREGEYSDQYLKRMVDLVNLAGKYNIYTLVQFHQDLFSQKFCADGVPIWAIPKQIYESFPRPVHKKKATYDPNTGTPNYQSCKAKGGWGEIYFTLAVNKGFGHLWKNKHGLLNKFAKYWQKVAAAFKGNPYVIAYELMNEPWPGNLYQDPLIMVPGLSEKAHLQRAYDFLSAEIRKVDPDHNICFEPVTWLNNFESGFTNAPGGKRYTNSSIFCYHYYSPPTLNLDSFMNARLKDVKRLKVGAILSEMFITGEQGMRNIAMMDKCDQHSHSWFGWYYSPQQSGMIKQIKRTFSHRVAGTIIHQSFKNTTRQYQLMYHADKSAGQTIIYFDSNQDYAGGINVNIYPGLSKVKYNIIDRLYLVIDSSQFEDGIPVLVVLTP